MERELKIVVSVFLVFLIYGLASLFNSGSFVTFSFLDKIVLTAISFLFWIMNIKENKSWVLLVYFFVMILYALNDQFTAGFLSQSFKSEIFYKLALNPVFNWMNITVFFGFFTVFIYQLFFKRKQYLVFTFAFLLIVSTIFFLGTTFIYWPHILMSSLLLFLFVYIQRFNPLPTKLYNTFSAQFLLLFLLTTIHYFT